MDPISLKYVFELTDGTETALSVQLDPTTLLDVSPLPADLPDWTRLEFHKCPNCPLTSEIRCPVALRVVDVIQTFGTLTSVDRVKVRVEETDRTTAAQTTLAAALASFMGLRMATSGCPVVAKLRPMARFHLPFASEDETRFRALATYLIAQLVRQQAGQSADFDLSKLKAAYAEIGVVNRAFAGRLRAALSQDAGANALVRLDLFAKAVPQEMNEWLEDFAPAFAAWR